MTLKFLRKLSNFHDKNVERGESVRAQLRALGGEQVTITTQDGVPLDGMYLSCDLFRSKLQEAGAQFCTVKSNSLPFTSALIIDPSAEEEVFNALDELRLCSRADNKDADYVKLKGAGYVKLEVKIGEKKKVLIVDEREISDAVREGKIVFNSGSKVYELKDTPSLDASLFTIQDINTTPNSERGTVLIGQGMEGFYEINKRTMLAYLMAGTNVMAFNYRGYGKSDGEPTIDGNFNDVEAVYQYLQKHHPVEDKKIVAAGLCYGGSVVAELVKNHPAINLFLDQSYAEVHETIANKVYNSLAPKKVTKDGTVKKIRTKKNFFYKAISAIAGAATKLLGPKLTTLDGLKAAEGKIFILASTQDDLVTVQDEIRKLQVLQKADKLGQVRVGSIPGEHIASWLDAQQTMEDKRIQYVGRNHVESFLDSVGLLQPLISRQRSINFL